MDYYKSINDSKIPTAVKVYKDLVPDDDLPAPVFEFSPVTNEIPNLTDNAPKSDPDPEDKIHSDPVATENPDPALAHDTILKANPVPELKKLPAPINELDSDPWILPKPLNSILPLRSKTSLFNAWKLSH